MRKKSEIFKKYIYINKKQNKIYMKYSKFSYLKLGLILVLAFDVGYTFFLNY